MVDIKAIVWDMGGVILRTENPKPRLQLCDEFRMTREDLEYLVFASESSKKAERGEISTAEHWKNIALKLNLDEDQLVKFQSRFWSGDQVDHQLIRYINELRPQYKTGLLSNAWSNAREEIGEKFDFLYAFDAIIYSAEVSARKPEPKIFHLMLEKLSVLPQQTVFIDDFENNLLGAENEGILGLKFENPIQIKRDLKMILSDFDADLGMQNDQ